MVKKIILDFSGNLDCLFCVPFLKEKYNAEIITVTVDTGGFMPAELEDMPEKSLELGAVDHINVDAKERIYNEYLTKLIKANGLRHNTYPLAIALERIAQVEEIINVARETGADAIAHGSTGYSNDQLRFDMALRTLAPDLQILAPVRDLGWSREQEAEYLEQKGFKTEFEIKEYTITNGLWGSIIMGKKTNDSWEMPPDSVFQVTSTIDVTPDDPAEIELGFENGIPTKYNGKAMKGLDIVNTLEELGALHGVGRGVYLSNNIFGMKSRVAFEAPAPTIIIKAHQELEKLVFTKSQHHWKTMLDQVYGDYIYTGNYFEPLLRNLEAFIESTQEKVSGDAKIVLHKGNVLINGVRSEHSLMQDASVLDHTNEFWTGAEAEGFCKMMSLPINLDTKKQQ